jgi:hypothetical protein
MTSQTIRPIQESRFGLSAWLVLSITIALVVYTIANLAYRYTLPTDGWDVNEGNLPGFAYTKNLMEIPSRLQPGDRVIAIEGIPADWQTIQSSPTIQEIWQAGATLDYTVSRQGEETHVLVTLEQWQLGVWLPNTLSDPGQLAALLSVCILLALAVFIFFRQPRNPAAGAFLIIIAILAISKISETLPSGFPEWIDPVANLIQNKVNWYILLALFPFALIRFALVFPHPKPIHQRHPWLSFAAGAIGVVLISLAPESPISWFWFVFSLLLTVIILIHNGSTMRDAVSQAQLRWGLGGLVIGLGILALMLLASTSGLFEINQDSFNLTSSFATTVMGSMLAVSILRYRLFDIDILIRRTVVYTILTATLALVYFGMTVLLEGVLRSLVGGSGQVATVISTLAIAALFNPLRIRIQDFIDRRFYRRKYNAEHALAVFATAARAETDQETLTAQVVNIVQNTMQPETVNLWLRAQETEPTHHP